MSTLCLIIGVLSGWLAHRQLLRQGVIADDQISSACPAIAQDTMQACEPSLIPSTAVFDQPVTGEGVISFTFYGPDATVAQRKWVTRIPLPSGQADLLGLVPNPNAAPLDTRNNLADSANNLPTGNEQPIDSPETGSNAERFAPESSAPKAAAPPKAAATAQDVITKPKATKPKTPPKPKPKPQEEPKEKANEKLEQILSETPSRGSGYTVQISAHKSRLAAEKQVGKLESKGFDGRIEKASVSGKGIWYRVRTGSGLSRERAQKLAVMIKQKLKLDTTILEQ